MIISIEPQSEIPLYTQLTNQIIEGIARGKLHPGDSLPSVRAFASDLGVNMHTVNKSYHQLEKKGIIRIIPKSGAIILKQDPTEMTEARMQQFIEEIRPTIAEALVVGVEKEKIKELVASMMDDLKKDN